MTTSKAQWHWENTATELQQDKPFHKINLEKSGDYSGLEELQTRIQTPRVFITGENHLHVGINGLIEFKLLQFLHAKAGVKHLILELGEARGWYANRYVNDLDTQERYCLQATTSVEHMKILDNIREWNRTLPVEQRIQIHGVDVERFNDIALMRLSDMLPKTGVPKSLYTAVHAVHQAAGWLKHTGLEEYEVTSKNQKYRAGTPPFSIDPSIDLIIAQFDSLDLELKNWMGSRYLEFQSGLEGLREYRQWNRYRNSAFYYTWREENIYRKLTRLLDSDSGSRFFGQFGRCHAAYSIQNGDCSWYAYQSVVHRLRERYFRSNRGVLSIGIYYEGDREIDAEANSNPNQSLISEARELLSAAPSGAVSIKQLDARRYPELEARFGFFIAVRKSLPTRRTPTQKTSELQFTLGATAYFLDKAKTVYDHVIPSKANQIHPTWTLSAGLNWHNRHFAASALLNTAIPKELYSLKDQLSVTYTLQTGSAYFGWRFTIKEKLSIDMGPQIFHATEKLKSRRLDGGFLSPASEPIKVAKNHALGVGMQARLQYRLLPYMQMGLVAGYLRDVSAPDWFMAKTNLYYARNLLKTQITGSSFSVFCNFDL